MTIDEIKGKLLAASAAGDVEAIIKLGKELDSLRKQDAKAEAERITKENEALAGKRQEIAEKIGAAFKNVAGRVFFDKATNTDSTSKVLEEVKATGYYFEYSIEKGLSYGLKHPTTAKHISKGGGATGTSKKEFGMSLQEIVDKWATDEEKAAIDAATSNSKSWQLKVSVKKRVIASGDLKPIK